jgi:hypothetical protein
MYNFYTNMLPEKRDAWRNAYEIKMAALEHEKRQFQVMGEYAPAVTARVQDKRNRQSVWTTMLKTPIRLLMILMG